MCTCAGNGTKLGFSKDRRAKTWAVKAGYWCRLLDTVHAGSWIDPLPFGRKNTNEACCFWLLAS